MRGDDPVKKWSTYLDFAGAAGTAPNPSRFIPMPSLSKSCSLPNGRVSTGADDVAALPLLLAAGALGVSLTAFAAFARASSSCRSRSRS